MALTLAHAVGLGIYRDGGLVQHFDDPQLWTDVGYEVTAGELIRGKDVTLRRRSDSYPPYFDEHFDRKDAITLECFENPAEQAEWVAASIHRNLDDDELEIDDILIILPEALTAKSDARVVMEALRRKGLRSHLVGVTSSQDEVFSRDSVAITGIYRAKGNEAPIVYVLNCDYAITSFEKLRARNALFTAITRSKAWVRLTGCGVAMKKFQAEFEAVKKRDYVLEYQIPTDADLEHMRKIHRDLSRTEIQKIKKGQDALRALLKGLELGRVDLESLPKDIRDGLRRIQGGSENDG